MVVTSTLLFSLEVNLFLTLRYYLFMVSLSVYMCAHMCMCVCVCVCLSLAGRSGGKKNFLRLQTLDLADEAVYVTLLRYVLTYLCINVLWFDLI